jgi:hypothetical protein
MSTKRVAITHIINPSCFWMRDLALADEELKQVTLIEKEIKREVKELENDPKTRFFEPNEKGEVRKASSD